MELTTYEKYCRFDPNQQQAKGIAYEMRVREAIASVSDKFCHYLNRQVQVGNYVDSFSPSAGGGTSVIKVSAYPIDEVNSITVYGTELSEDRYTVDKLKGKIYFHPPILRDSELSGCYMKSIVVDYVGGMAVDTEEFISKYPAIVGEVHAQMRFELSRITNIAEKSQSTDGNSTQLEAYDLIPSVIRSLNHFANRGLIF